MLNVDKKYQAEHKPILLQQVMKALMPQDNEIIIDCTFGYGGYSCEFLNAATCRVFGIDRDPAAVACGEDLAQKSKGRFTMLAGRFSQVESLLASHNVGHVHGIVLDIGVSSPQLDKAERGFSFQNDGPLDMRMSCSGQNAADLVNTLPEKDLADLIYKYGEEHKSRRIARTLVQRRLKTPFTRTLDLAQTIASVMPYGKTHPATKTFQALRIAINQELDELEKILVSAENLLAPNGRLVVVTFHSLEDRIVKRFLNERSGNIANASRHSPLIVAADTSQEATFTLIRRKATIALPQEIEANPRARSAKLRAAFRTSTQPRTNGRDIFIPKAGAS